MSDFNPFNTKTLKEASEAAEKYAANSNFGKLNIQMRYLRFAGPGEKPAELDEQEFNQAKENGESNLGTEVVFEIDPSSFNPQAQFIYSRKVSVTAKTKIEVDGKTRRVPSDWMKTVLPSIEATFGSIDNLGEALSNKKGVWVEVTDVPQVGAPEYGVTKFVRVFKNEAECAAAWREKFGKNLPAEAVKSAKGLLAALSGDEEQFTAAVAADESLSKFDVHKLLAAAKA